MLKGRRGSDKSCASMETTSTCVNTPTKSCVELTLDSAQSTPGRERDERVEGGGRSGSWKLGG